MSKKNAILRHATTLFARQGFEATTMAAVSALSGVASATIFYHFSTKEELLLAILARIRKRIIARFECYENGRDRLNGYQAVEGAITYYLNLAAEMEDEFLLLHRHFPYQLADVHPVSRENLAAIYDRIVEIIEAAIATGQKDGSITDLPVHKTALILFSTVDGLIRLNAYKLYDATTLFSALMDCCGRILRTPSPTRKNGAP